MSYQKQIAAVAVAAAATALLTACSSGSTTTQDSAPPAPTAPAAPIAPPPPVEPVAPEPVAPAYSVPLSESAGDGPDKYRQTWPKNYAQTSCSEWLTQMTPDQRWAGAADMLTGLWGVDGTQDLPPDTTVATFADGVSNGCLAAPMSVNVSQAGTMLYVSEKTRFGPS